MEHSIWVEKYRPDNIEDCILPDKIKKPFLKFISSGDIPNLLLSGKPGLGKTTIAKALINDIDADMFFINASKDGNIDTLRTTIQQFASRKSLSGGKKFVLLDEADYLNANSTQPALRSFIEEFSKNCGFILTCNYPNRILEPLRKRLVNIDFTMPNEGDDEWKHLIKQTMLRFAKILNKENCEFDKRVLLKFISSTYPDLRSCLNELQFYSKNGKIDEGILSAKYLDDFEEVYELLKNKDFKSISRWVDNNRSIDIDIIIEKLLNNYTVRGMDKSCIGDLILILNEYDYKSKQVSNEELNKKAMFMRLLFECKFE